MIKWINRENRPTRNTTKRNAKHNTTDGERNSHTTSMNKKKLNEVNKEIELMNVDIYDADFDIHHHHDMYIANFAGVLIIAMTMLTSAANDYPDYMTNSLFLVFAFLTVKTFSVLRALKKLTNAGKELSKNKKEKIREKYKYM